ncbi:MAG: dihydropteroate synthase [Xanthomonadaceae bacterium]|nr:dihydropteroate synthase [Xanthomonadaceae bacterium]
MRSACSGFPPTDVSSAKSHERSGSSLARPKSSAERNHPPVCRQRAHSGHGHRERDTGFVLRGADILDVGGESTRPGADPVDVEAEIGRVVPVIKAIRAELDVPVSIDTMKADVMRAAVTAGAGMINDVNGLRDPDALGAAAELGVHVCIMHMQGQPRTMQQNPQYSDVVEDLLVFFRERVAACLKAGIAEHHLVLDPGFGFGKSLEHNLDLLARFGRLREFGLPLLAGLSRKSMLGKITGREDADQRVAASLAGAVLAAERGANILRVHDVAETVDAVKVIHALRGVTS